MPTPWSGRKRISPVVWTSLLAAVALSSCSGSRKKPVARFWSYEGFQCGNPPHPAPAAVEYRLPTGGVVKLLERYRRPDRTFVSEDHCGPMMLETRTEEMRGCMLSNESVFGWNWHLPKTSRDVYVNGHGLYFVFFTSRGSGLFVDHTCHIEVHGSEIIARADVCGAYGWHCMHRNEHGGWTPDGVVAENAGVGDRFAVSCRVPHLEPGNYIVRYNPGGSFHLTVPSTVPEDLAYREPCLEKSKDGVGQDCPPEPYHDPTPEELAEFQRVWDSFERDAEADVHTDAPTSSPDKNQPGDAGID